MSTAIEIEAALPLLTLEELHHLDAAVNTALRTRETPRVRTAKDACGWWERTERFSKEEGESFAHDIEEGRKSINQSAAERWA